MALHFPYASNRDSSRSEEVSEAQGGKYTGFSGGFFETESAKRLWACIYIPPEVVSPIMTKKDPEKKL